MLNLSLNTTTGQHGWPGGGLICSRVRRKSSARDFMQLGLQGCSNLSRTSWLDNVVGTRGSRFAIPWASSTEGSVNNWESPALKSTESRAQVGWRRGPEAGTQRQ